MRKLVYQKISNQLAAMLKMGKRSVPHIDLWNNQLQHIEDEKAFKLPAVFIEFKPLEWRQGGDKMQRAVAELHLHIIGGTLARSYDSSRNQAESLFLLELCDDVHKAMSALEADYMGRPVRTMSMTDHDHAQLQHFIEVYRFDVIDLSARPQYEEVLVQTLKVDELDVSSD